MLSRPICSHRENGRIGNRYHYLYPPENREVRESNPLQQGGATVANTSSPRALGPARPTKRTSPRARTSHGVGRELERKQGGKERVRTLLEMWNKPGQSRTGTKPEPIQESEE